MRAYGIEMAPFQMLAIVNFESKMGVNEHGYAQISGYISEEQKNEIMSVLGEETWCSIRFLNESGEKNVLFCGYAEDMRIHAEAGTYLLTLRLKTGTGLMDLKPHIRVYQNSGTTYRRIQESHMSVYKNANLLMGADDSSIGSMVVQYKETDWEFAKRLASRKGTVLFPNEKSAGVKYTFGIIEENIAVLSDYMAYSIVKNLTGYHKKKKNGMSQISEADVMGYKIRTREVYYLGDYLNFLGGRYIVREVERKWTGGELDNYYTLETAAGLQEIIYYNKKIIGASLKGTVAAVQKDMVQITVNEDESGGWDGKKWFAYSTVFSSPDGTGWYCMPEQGDSVRLYFPNEKEDEAFVNSSVNEASSDSGARSNPDNKSIKNKQGKEILFMPNKLLITNNKGMYIEINDDEGIKVESDKNIVIKAKQSIGLVSDEQGVELAAPEQIVFEQGGTSLALSDDVVVQGGRVNMQ